MSLLEVEMGDAWGGEAILRPNLHWQCQPPSRCSPNPASGSFREAQCGVSTWEEHSRGAKMGGFGVERPF